MDVDEGDLFSVVFAGRSGHSLLHTLTNPASARPSQPQSHYGVSSLSADCGLNCSRNAFTPVPLSFPCRTSSSSSNLFNIPPFLLDNPPYVKLENPSPSQSRIIDSVKIISGNNNKLPVRTECLPSLPCKRAGLNAPPTKQQSSKRRKEQTKRIVCVPASSSSGANSTEFLPSDMWSWRKYGQKPIKGSPYPRSYYRCSSSKGCPARKQVERSRNDSAKLIMTYMSEHNHAWPTHRNALAGSIRHPEANLPCPSLEQAESSPPLPPPDDGSHIHDDGSHTHDDEDNDNDDEDDADADDVHEHDPDDQHSIDMELQMLKYATEHFTGDDFLTFPTDLVNQS